MINNQHSESDDDWDDHSSDNDHGSSSEDEESSSNDDWSNDDDETPSSEEDLFEPLFSFGGMRRRRPSGQQQQEEKEENSTTGSPRQARRQAYTTSRRNQQPLTWGQIYRRHYLPLCGIISTYAVVISFIVWLTLTLYNMEFDLETLSYFQKYSGGDARRFGGQRSPFTWPTGGGGEVVEKLPKGCVRPGWHSFNFPNCNEIHEVDLQHVIRQAFLEKLRYLEHESDKPYSKTGYLASGLWRSVWALHPRSNPKVEEPLAVLKVMKKRHEFDTRNLERHRRDALVMERLTASPYVVNMYAYCANSVLTEYIGSQLDDFVPKHSPSDTTTRASSSIITNSTERVRMFLEVAKSLQALHSIEGGPIVHADVQPQQFMVQPSGHLKINDFNRCRFVARYAVSGKQCPFQIPTAPGKARAPEEYDFQKLDEKIDIFALANVYYELLTGDDPWKGVRQRDVKQRVADGIKPVVPEEFLRPGTLEAVLSELILQSYEVDPKNRPSADELVVVLEGLLLNATASNGSDSLP